ncbi:MAG: ABC transporter ATP-binding protein [Clostridiales bacterium]|nr:ABC transporter ATP-binding protein [Clostridiales bacterium]
MFKNILTILKSVRENLKPTILCLIFIIGEVVMEVLIPFITSYLVNRIKAGEGLGGIVSTGLLMVAAALASLAFGVLAGKHSAFASAGLARNLRHDMYVKIQDFSFANIDKFSSSSLVTRMTTDITNVQNAYMMCIRIAVRAPVMLMFAIVMGTIMGGRLATTFLVIIPVLLFGLIIIGRLAMPAFRSVFRKYDRLNESVEENVRGMRVVKGFAREEYESEKFEDASDDIRRDFTKAERIVGLNGPIMQLCLYFNLAFVLFVGSEMIVKSKGVLIDVGQISAMITYGFQILMSLMMINMIYIVLTMSVESIKRIAEVLRENPSITNPENAVTEMTDGSIEFKDVSFKYSETAKLNALCDINVRIESGMTVGVLGGTGSGKTSLIQLIPRLYDATVGEVKVGGRPVKEYDLKFLRDNVSVVLQKNELFSGTIRENLKWGNENATDEEIFAAAKLACADEFINSFPDGYDTHIEQGGTNVSGGQKQRLCIARALLKNPKILILDDSTSAVDMRTDALIRKGLKEYIPETTKIIIAQRVASVMDADLILIMEGGKLVSSGTHDELLKSSDIYREIYEQQTKGGDEQ